MNGTSQTARDEVMQAEQARRDALLAGDRRDLEGLYTSDFVYVHSSGRKEERESYLSTQTSGDNKYSSFADQDIHVDVIGEVALMTGTIHIHRAKGVNNFLFVEVWVRQGGGWKLKYQHNTKNAA